MGSTDEFADIHHHLQLSLVGALEEVLRRGTDRPLAQETLERLLDFTEVHFRSEELLMRLRRYPHAEAHAAAHAAFLELARPIRHSFASGEASASLAAVGRIREWLQGHIGSLDRELGAWQAGSSAPPPGP
jgi:hemerythrin